MQKSLRNFSSVHGLPEQRFYNGLCMAYGADSVLFADVVTTGLLPTIRAENCEHEYQTFDCAFKSEIRPHIDRQLARAVLSMTWFPETSARPFRDGRALCSSGFGPCRGMPKGPRRVGPGCRAPGQCSALGYDMITDLAKST